MYASSIAAAQGGLGGNPEQMQQIMGQMMNSPMMQSVMNNPEVLRNMLQSNPAIAQVQHCLVLSIHSCAYQAHTDGCYLHVFQQIPAAANPLRYRPCSRQTSMSTDYLANAANRQYPDPVLCPCS